MLPALSLVWDIDGVLYFFIQVENSILYAGAEDVGDGWKVWAI
jgi:hypothetical protein